MPRTEICLTSAETGSRASLNSAALAIAGEATKAKQYAQTVTVSGSAGDSYSFGGWVKTGSVSLSNVSSQHEDDPTRRCGIQVRLLNGETVVEEKYIPINEACREWQFLSGSIQADGAYTKMEYALQRALIGTKEGAYRYGKEKT